ncbi:MAG: beta-propeller domain-containing protein [Phycisphaerae bacterium]|nr:beta-propeller domain-containing protein [Phycisphaerae bacterium]
MKRLCALALPLALLTSSGCDFLSTNVPPSASPNLKRFESEQEFQQYFNAQVESNGQRVAEPGGLIDFDDAVADGAPPPAPVQGGSGEAAGEADAEPVSGTTIQEEGVDEADVVKTDGTFVYVLSDSELRIARITPADQLDLLGRYTLEGYAQDMYLRGERIIAITQTFGDLIFYDAPLPADDVVGIDDSDSGGVAAEGTSANAVGADDPIEGPEPFAPFQYSRPQTIVTILDVSDRSAPLPVSTTSFDGTQASSRMIDGTLHLVLANYQNYYFDVLPVLGTRDMSQTQVPAETVIPHFTRQGPDGTTVSGDVVTWENLYRPEDPDGFGIVSVVSMNVDGDGTFAAVGLVAEPGLIYSSTQALYLTNTQYDFLGTQRSTTAIYKLAYSDSGATPVAAGSVPGRILNQYSMGEYDGYLRVASTVDPTFFPDGQRTESTNNVYVLGESDGTLAIMGSVENIAPGETVQSARFIGNRGFVVTFRQIDPLFTLDISDPASPRIVGELKVPGFSTFIVPMDENHLLTVGQYIPEGDISWPRGVQLSIFDVSDFANPILAHNVVLTDEQAGAWSEALYNPKAFTYFPENDMVALPVSIYDAGPIFVEEPAPTGSVATVGSDGATVVENQVEPVPPLGDDTGNDGTEVDVVEEPWVPGGFDGLVVYHATAANGFQEMGRIDTRFVEEGYFYPYFTRGVFVGDRVYAVTNYGIRGGMVSDMTAMPYELLIAEPVSYDPPIPVEPDGGIGDGVAGSEGPAR